MQIKFEDTISYSLAKLSTAFRTTVERYMNKIGLHGGQTFVLLELWREDGLRQVDLAARLNLSAPTVNKILRGLLEMRLVTRSRGDEDARATRIYLTPTGKTMRGEVEDQWLELEESCLKALTEAERFMLFELLAKLRTTYTGSPQPEEEL